MWECPSCKEKDIKDKYKHCWNCGAPKPIDEVEEVVYVPLPEPEPIINVEPQLTSRTLPEPEPQIKETPLYESDFLSGYKSSGKEKPPSKIGKIIPVLLWLIAFFTTSVFVYLSYQKMNDFTQKIESEKQNFNAQKSQFVFPPKPLMEKGSTIGTGNIKTKVLPLNLKNSEVENLFAYLPDDLRPTSTDEVKTLMWIDCKNKEVGRYADGSTGFQENCQVFLVDKETSKFVGIQEFLGVMPALSKEKEGNDAVGRVSPEKYVAYLREKQPESERTTIESASDSPNHHFVSKSEFIYGLLLLGLFGAIGLGWLAYKIKFDWRTE